MEHINARTDDEYYARLTLEDEEADTVEKKLALNARRVRELLQAMHTVQDKKDA